MCLATSALLRDRVRRVCLQRPTAVHCAVPTQLRRRCEHVPRPPLEDDNKYSCMDDDIIIDVAKAMNRKMNANINLKDSPCDIHKQIGDILFDPNISILSPLFSIFFNDFICCVIRFCFLCQNFLTF